MPASVHAGLMMSGSVEVSFSLGLGSASILLLYFVFMVTIFPELLSVSCLRKKKSTGLSLSGLLVHATAG